MVSMMFDVDSWIGATMPSLLPDNSLVYQYISDYNLDIFQVCKFSLYIYIIYTGCKEKTFQNVKRRI